MEVAVVSAQGKKKTSFGKRLENGLHALLARIGAWKCRHVWTTVDPRKIVFNQFQGSGFGCNPKYIALELLRRRNDLDLVWLARNPAEVRLPPGIRAVKWKSPQALRELATAGVWVSNHNLGHFIKNRGLVKKPGQRYYQTWHGSFGIKYCAAPFEPEECAMVDGFIVHSDLERRRGKRWFGDRVELYPFGHARNDLIVNAHRRASDEVRTFLYVPTFRDDGALDAYLLDFAAVKTALVRRWPVQWKIQVRLHPNLRKKGIRLPFVGDVEDVTDYPDIQELLARADVVVSDYSSCIFDFALSGRPGFLYAPDRAKYESDRGFEYPLSAAPFPVTESLEELTTAIENFDEAGYAAVLSAFFAEKGSVERGIASREIADLILGM